MFYEKFLEKIKTHTSWLITFFQNSAFYEIMSKNVVEPEWPQMLQYDASKLHAE